MRAGVTSIVLLLPLLACEAGEPPELYNPGDPCNFDFQVCLDDESALSCEDRSWTALPCAQLCARLGPSFVAEGCELGCVCVPADPQACVPGQTQCIDDATLGVCDDQQVLEAFACAQLCDEQGLIELGCVAEVELAPGIVAPAECWCTNEATPCDADATPSCVDDATLAACVDGVWVFEDCAQQCGQSGAQCDPWQTPAACGCS